MSPAQYWFLWGNISLVTFFAIFAAAGTIIANACIQGELALSQAKASWLVTVYLLGLNSTVPISNWIGQRFTFERTYAFGAFLFTLGTLMVCFTEHFRPFAFGRLIEGMGGGLIFPSGVALIGKYFPSEKLALGINLYVAFAIAGGIAIGVPIVGYLSEFYVWRAAFFAILPFTTMGGLFAWHLFRRMEKKSSSAPPFDVWGYLAFLCFITSILISLNYGPLKSTAEGWRAHWIVSLFLIAFLSLIATIWIELRSPNPFLPIPLFKNPVFVISCLSLFMLGLSYFASLNAMNDYMQRGLLYDRWTTAKVCSVYGIGMGLCTLLSNYLSQFISVRYLTFFGLTILIYSYFLNNELSWLTGWKEASYILILRGIGIGICLGPITAHGMQEVPKEWESTAATLLTFFRQVGITYGGVLLNIFVIKRTIFHAARYSEQMNPQLPGYQETLLQLSSTFFSDRGAPGVDPTLYAGRTIVKNMESQAFIQAINDGMLIFGYIAIALFAALLFLYVRELWREKREVGVK